MQCWLCWDFSSWESIPWAGPFIPPFALSFFVSACEFIYPLQAPLTHDVFLELCFAVILPAVGAAMVFNVGASTGGTDIVAMILHKYTSLEIGRALLVSDLGIVLVAAYLYGAQSRTLLYAWA